MKNIYIGDIHGLSSWEKIVKDNNDADNIVFIGDYLDSFDVTPIEQLNNLKKIINFKLNRELDPTKKVYLLIGNHDIHYIRGNKDGGMTSGYQPIMRHSYEQLLHEHMDKFQMCVVIGDKLCTHAGVSDVFLSDVGYYTNTNTSVDDFLNSLFKYKPNEFIFSAPYNRGYTMMDGYGGDTFQSPLWIRPLQLQRANKKTELKKDFIQIVGHTAQNKLNLSGKTTGGKYIYIDTMPYGEYLIEIDGTLSVGKI